MTARRRGFTLFELIIVMALLLLLAALVLPSLGAFRGDTRQRAAADVIRGELAVARSRAMEEGRPYRVALSEDATRIRRAPDGTDFAQTSASDHASGSAAAVDYAFDFVTAHLVADGDVQPPVAENGWQTVVTALPNGTCREDTALIGLKEDGNQGMYIRVRGLTGGTRLLPNTGTPPTSGGAK